MRVGKPSRSVLLRIPILLLYDGGEKALGETLGMPLAALNSPPQSILARGDTILTVELGNASTTPELAAPPFWTVSKSPASPAPGGKRAVQFTVTSAAGSVREADLTVTLRDSAGTRSGELYFRAPVSK